MLPGSRIRIYSKSREASYGNWDWDPSIFKSRLFSMEKHPWKDKDVQLCREYTKTNLSYISEEDKDHFTITSKTLSENRNSPPVNPMYRIQPQFSFLSDCARCNIFLPLHDLILNPNPLTVWWPFKLAIKVHKIVAALHQAFHTLSISKLNDYLL